MEVHRRVPELEAQLPATGASPAAEPAAPRELLEVRILLTQALFMRYTDCAVQGRATPGPTGSFPTPAEVHAAIPPSGILTGDLSRAFRSRLGPSKENHQRFIEIVKKVSVYGKEDRMLRPGPWKET